MYQGILNNAFNGIGIQPHSTLMNTVTKNNRPMLLAMIPTNAVPRGKGGLFHNKIEKVSPEAKIRNRLSIGPGPEITTVGLFMASKASPEDIYVCLRLCVASANCPARLNIRNEISVRKCSKILNQLIAIATADHLGLFRRVNQNTAVNINPTSK